MLPLSSAQTDAPAQQAAEQKAPESPFEAAYRTRSYKAVEPVKELADRLMLSGYDIYENPTGIYFPEGAKVTVTLDGAPSTPVKLYVKDFSERGKPFDEYELKDGDNELTIGKSGLGYIHYEATDYKKAPEIKVTIKGGEVNGVFTDKDDNETWKKLLANAKSPFMDLYGKHVHLAFPVKSLQEFCPDEGAELLAFYDKVIAVEQKIIGFGYKTDRPRNHIFGRSVPSGYMFADGIGAGFNVNTMKHVASMKSLMDPRHITFGFWGIAHEFGHVNQTRPGFKWLGMTEVTNNLMAMACCYHINKPILRLEREPHNDGTMKIPGGYYNSFTKSALIDGEKWQMQAAEGDTGHSHVSGGNVFVKLIPFWQLYLYTTVSGQANENFYPEFHLWLRTDRPEAQNDGIYQLNFMKMACEINQQDLTDYFEAVGMLKPIDVEMKDYKTGRITITEEECKELRQFASQYAKPATALIQYINANNIDCYKGKLALEGPDTPGEGVEIKDNGSCIVSHKVWKNAVAFETYAGDKLIRIALSGVGAPAYGDPETLVYLPDGATEIKAVSWDGKRKTVYTVKKDS